MTNAGWRVSLTTLRRTPNSRWFAAVGCALATVALGCAASGSVLEIKSFRDPHFPEDYRVVFDQCAYRHDRDGDYQITARAARAPDGGSSVPIVQLLHVHVFWKPVPGKTSDDSSGVDATIRYVVASEEGASVFSGTGFVFPRRDWRKRFIAEIEGGRLQLVARIGTPPDVVGDSRITGRLLPLDDAGLTVEMLRELDRRSTPK